MTTKTRDHETWRKRVDHRTLEFARWLCHQTSKAWLVPNETCLVPDETRFGVITHACQKTLASRVDGLASRGTIPLHKL